MTDLYVIVDLERGQYWRQARCGYTPHLHAAGVYSRAEALAICADARVGWAEGDPLRDMPVRLEDARDCRRPPESAGEWPV